MQPVNPLSPVPVPEIMLDQFKRVTRVWLEYFIRAHQTLEEVEALAVITAMINEPGAPVDAGSAALTFETGQSVDRASDATMGQVMAALVASDPSFQGIVNAAVSQAMAVADGSQVPRETALAEALQPSERRWSELASIADTHANRAKYSAAAYPEGSEYFETDRQITYVSVGGAWKYKGGIYVDSSAPSAVQGSTPSLGANDAGLFYSWTTYSRVFRWTGGAWERGPGSTEPAGQLVATTGDENPGNGYGYVLLNGTSATVTTAIGGTTSITIPDVTVAQYLKIAAAASLGPHAASGATASGVTGLPTATFDPDGAGDAAYVPPDPGHTHGPGTLQLANTVWKAYVRQ